jgi:hypothetical protein
MWQNGGIQVGIATNNQTRPKSVSDGSGGVIIAFQDKRSGTFDIYAHHLDQNGSTVIGEINGGDNLMIIPHPMQSNAILTGVSRIARVDEIEIFDVCGRNCSSLFSLQLKESALMINRMDASQGIYFIRLKEYTARLVVTD